MTTWRLGIIGWPLGYSLSPRMHNAVLEEAKKVAGWNGDCTEYPVEPGGLHRWLEEEAPKLDGFNVTMPHKEEVFKWLEQHGEIHDPVVVGAIGAVNTVKKEENGCLAGYNTDGGGFFRGLSEPDAFKGKQALMLGAGGAAQAIAVELAWNLQVGSLKIWNRHSERAEKLVRKVESLESPCAASAVSNLADISFDQIDLIINATPLGMKGCGEIPQEILNGLREQHVVYDIVYEPRQTGLIRAARQKKCREVITGDVMLANQAAEAFEIWTDSNAVGGVPIRDIMWKALEKELDERPASSGSQ